MMSAVGYCSHYLSPVSLTPVPLTPAANLPQALLTPISTTPVARVAKFAAGVVDAPSLANISANF
jgi:hypothetical protein